MECESLVVASLMNNVGSCNEVYDRKNSRNSAKDSDGINTHEDTKLNGSCANDELRESKRNSKQNEKPKVTRSVSHPVMVAENSRKNATSNHDIIRERYKESEMHNKWRRKGRNVSFDECVHVLTQCSVIEIPLKNSILENNKSSTCCKCRKGILKHGEDASGTKKTVTFEQEEILKSAILNRNLSEFSKVCQQWEVNFNKKLSVGLTPLHLASTAGSFRIVQYILANGGKVDERNELGWTALHHAVSYGHIPCALILLQAGADLNACTDDHWTAMELAKQDEMLLLLGRVMNGKSSLDQNKETYV
jgi:hypothetical protein